jgi:alanine racemase
VARVLEGAQLRQAGIDAPILVLGYTPPHEALLAVEHDLSLAVIDPAVAEAGSARAVALGRTVKVHVKVDSGMGRFGLLPEEVLPFLAYLAAQPGLRVEGIFTHFATADSADKTAVRRQFALFSAVLGAAAAAGYAIPLRHCANSAAILDLPETYLDAVRPGIALYGLRPSDEVAPTVELHPALTLKSHVGRVRLLPAGSGVSYGLTYVAPTAITAALVPVGYGDGYPRLLSNRGMC